MDGYKWVLISYCRDSSSLVGSLRMSRLEEFLKNKGCNVDVISNNYDSSSIYIKNNKLIYKLRRLLNFIAIPDSSIFWAKKASRYLNHYHNENKCILVTSSPPHGIHSVSLNIEKRNKFIWIADFRDPFTMNKLYDNKKHKCASRDIIYEESVFNKCDILIFNSDYDKNIHCNRYEYIESKSFVIRNGYDKMYLFDGKNKYPWNSFVYSGGTYKGEATKHIGMFIRKLNDYDLSISCDMYGENDNIIEEFDCLNFITRLPNESVQKKLAHYKFGLIYLPHKNISSGRVPQKLYDYIGSGVIPICINPSIEMKNIINEINIGILVYNINNIEKIIYDINKYKKEINPNYEKIKKYSRNNQFQKITDII